MNKYLMLAISIVTEVFGASMLKISNGMENVIPLVGAVLGYVVSFLFLGLLLKKMSLSVAYAIWAGLGTVLTAVVSIVFFEETFTVVKSLGIFIIVLGIIVLNMDTGKQNETNETY